MLRILLFVALFSATMAQSGQSVCPPGLGLFFCFVPSCSTENCTRFPDADCSNDQCGVCTAAFTDTTTQEIIPKFACDEDSNWPQCLSTIRCPSQKYDCSSGCPRVPDAVCNLNCDCTLAFTDSRNGRVLSAVECGREFDDRCPLAPFLGFGSCSVCQRTCPPDHICCPNGCFGGPSGSSCIPVPRASCPPIDRRDYRFTCTDENSIGSECLLFCDPDQFLIGNRSIECLADGQWSHELDSIRCIRDVDIDGRCPAVSLIGGLNCPVCPSTCPSGEICCPNGCPGSTGCIPIPTPTAPPCPPDRRPVNCAQSPCQAETCPRFPNAICIDDFCGKCSAIFINPDTGDVIPKFACARSSNWPQCLAFTLCQVPPPSFNCETACPNQPNANCNMNCDCSLEFTDSRTGDLFSRQECRNFPSNCPAQPPIRGGCTGNEPTCRRPCPRPLVCCPVGCGSQCIDLSPPTTTPATTTLPSATCSRRIVPNLRYRCGHHRFNGIYFCYLRCNSGYTLDGPDFVRCLGGRFNPSIDEVKCDRNSPNNKPYRPCSVCGR